MASVQMLKCSLSPIPVSQSNFPGKSSWAFPEFQSRTSLIRLSGYRAYGYHLRNRRRFGVCCKAQESDSKSNGEEPPESLFMKELRRRGMNPTSLLEEKERTEYGMNEEMRNKDRGFSARNAVSTEIEKSLANQRERSMQLNSEGLEKIEQEKLEKLARKGPKPEEKPAGSSGGSVSDAKPSASSSGASTAKVSTDKYRNYAVVAGVMTAAASVGWYLKASRKKEEVQD